MIYTINWVRDKFDKGESIKFIFFWGHSNKGKEQVGKFVFSQWFFAPFSVNGVEFKTSEHWMMAEKAKLFGDQKILEKIIKSKKPGEAKELGREVANFDQLKWDAKKYEIVKSGCLLKFRQNKSLREYLIDTGDRVLVEASPVDTVWGIGLAPESEGIDNPHKWRGLNLLGFALMETRDFLRGEILK